ncbi:MAG: sulfite exporter TauE/SafE family protein, partial [Acidimicrobiia bacterium]
IERESFERFFGLLLLAVSLVLLFLRSPAAPLTSEGAWMVSREIVDYRGVRHLYNIPMLRGLAISVMVGCLSSLFGIGGGIIHVPAMILLLQVPVPVATATSQFILAITSLAGSVTHLALGHLQGGGAMTLWLALGAVPGAQFGAALSRRLQAGWIVIVLAGALMLAAVRLIG